MKKVINSALSRRHFLRLTSVVAASALTPTVLWAEQQQAADSATSQAVPARIATFEEVWRTVRDRFYDPHLDGLDWSAVRERYLPDATRASSEEALAGVINSMLLSCMLRTPATTHRTNQSTTSFLISLLVR
ncbi:hypothetical protein [Bradyrhizobium sp. S3.2.12]|uniref:hypothetical protein n=1 Tax=Bradyrhizobium sp. S3.2.12 TaxID=3156387 RepID=UPI0033982573